MSFISNLFKTPEEHVTLKQAKELFEEIQSKKRNEKQKIIEDFDNKIKENVEFIEQAFEKLKNAKLMNENLYPKERAIMEGNRKSYLHYGEILIKRLKRTNQVSNISAAVTAFSGSTVRNFNVLLEFFETEVRDVAKGLREINDLITEKAQHTLKSRSTMVSQFFDELDKIDEKKKQLIKEIKEKKIEIHRFEKEIAKTKREIDELKKSNEIKEYNDLEKDLNNKKEKQKKLEYKIYHAFFQFSKYLRKLYNLYEDSTLKNLIGSPVNTFIEDPNACFNFLNELKTAIKNGKISVKAGQTQKVMEKLSKIDERELRSIRAELKDIKKDILNIKGKMLEFTVFNVMDEKHYQLKVLERRLSEIKIPEDVDYDVQKRMIYKQIQSGLSKLTHKKIILTI